MYKVVKGFILTNGFEGKVGENLPNEQFTKKEIASLTKDGSIKPEKPGKLAKSAKVTKKKKPK